MKNYFLQVMDLVKSQIENHEKFTAWFSAESLDYVRFNHAKLRQAGTVEQAYLSLNLIVDQSHATASIGLSKNVESDTLAIKNSLKKMRSQISQSSPDPFLTINETNNSSENITASQLQDKEYIVNKILELSRGLDLVGYYFGGPIYKGFFNSTGQVNWFEKSSLVIDTSVYHSGDKAIKQSYADTTFNEDKFNEKIQEAKMGLKMYEKEPMTISPGKYRVYFAPSAVYELLSMMNWGGFSRKALEVKSSPLQLLFSDKKLFSDKFSLQENTQAGIGPNFQSQGFIKKDSISLIENGLFKNTLISPKTAKEYCLDHNGSDDDEGAHAMDIAAGTLKQEDILTTLNDGLYINNLWYLNFSDRQNGCLTGMTRFLCYAVKGGKPLAPFSVMRFDDSLFNIFGKNLIALTSDRELLVDTSTYDQRSIDCAYTPGVMAENVRFTL